MNNKTPNQFTGYRSPGFRFPFRVRSIAHRCLFLPLAMKNHNIIKRLINGESPLTVFHTDSIHSARAAFNELRKKFDFPYWAITEYFIRDLNNADKIITLRLNSIQHYLIDIMQKRYHNHQTSRYIITKTLRRCGLTTCVQAYILWLQTFQCQNNSYTCSSSSINLNPLKSDICRYLHRDILSDEPWISIPKANAHAFFNTYRKPEAMRGINLGYVHFADMSKWKDPDGNLTSRVFNAAVGGVLLDFFTLVILEGNIPKQERFSKHLFKSRSASFQERISKLQSLGNNPFFLDFAINTATHPLKSHIIHINLDDTFYYSRRLQVPLLNNAEK